MAQYYADIQGNRGTATRMGTKNSGMDGHIRGWSIGARVYMSHNEETDQDECSIILTGGSNGHSPSRTLGTYTAADLEGNGDSSTYSVNYKAIAEIVKDSKREEGIATMFSTKWVGPRNLATRLADYFGTDNPCFDRTRFLAACGL